MCVKTMEQTGVYELLKLLEMAIEDGFTIIPGKFVVVKPEEIYTLIERIYATIPPEIQDARNFLKRIEEHQMEAQQRAEKIINDAQMEAERKLSEADFIKAVEREGLRIRNQVQEECEELKRKALEEAGFDLEQSRSAQRKLALLKKALNDYRLGDRNYD